MSVKSVVVLHEPCTIFTFQTTYPRDSDGDDIVNVMWLSSTFAVPAEGKDPLNSTAGTANVGVMKQVSSKDSREVS